MTPKLTAEDLRSLQYFWDERGDPTRWCDFEKKKPSIIEHAPRFWAAWQTYQNSIKELSRASKDLFEDTGTEDEE